MKFTKAEIGVLLQSLENTKQNPTRELVALLEAMRKTGTAFNCSIVSTPGDADYLALADNGVGWEACCETGKYDLWFNGDMKHQDLTVDQAAKILVTKYLEDKMKRVYKRIANGSRS